MDRDIASNNLLNISQTLNDIIADMNLNDFHSLNDDEVELNFLNTDEISIEDGNAKTEADAVPTSQQTTRDNINSESNNSKNITSNISNNLNVSEFSNSILKNSHTTKDENDFSRIYIDHSYCSVLNKDKDTLSQDPDLINLKSNILDYILKLKYSDETFGLETYIDSIIKNIDIYVNKTNTKDRINLEVYESEDQERERKLREDLILENIMDVMTAEEDISEHLNESEHKYNNNTNLRELEKISPCHTQHEEGSTDKKLDITKKENGISLTNESLEMEKLLKNDSDADGCQLKDHDDENLNQSSLSSSVDLSLLHSVTNFAKLFYEDCLKFNKSDLENDLIESFIHSKAMFLRNFICIKPLMLSKEQQTDICYSNKLASNKSFKKSLLSNSYSDTSSYFSEKISISVKQQQDKSKKNKYRNNSNTFNEYDDGIPMIQYIQSEIFGNGNPSYSDSSSINRHRRKFSNLYKSVKGDMNPIAGISQVCDSFKKYNCCSESDKENTNRSRLSSLNISSNEQCKTDKEIERLINFNALEKRPGYNGSNKFSEDFTKVKIPKKAELKDDDFFKFIEEELPKDDSSDGSVYETDEEYLTEAQYLQKRNENLKQEFLCPSSCDSEEFDDEEFQFKTNNSEEDRSKSPLVDQFLKSFVVKNDENNVESTKPGNGDFSNLILQDVNSNNTEDEVKDIELKESTDVEMELLAKNNKQEGKPKCLEKMLLEVEKRKKIGKIDEDLINLSSDSNDSDIESIENDETNQKSRVIKQMLRTDQLATDTRKAQKEENERIKRLEKKISRLSELVQQKADEIQNDFILDYIEDTKTFINVHQGIVKHLKKHQFDGIKFMYDSCFGSVQHLKKFSGSGCILAHCMGLGKTLQLIALLHTVISYKELTTSKILVLCPKSTVMNWADEIRRWLGPLNTRNYRVFAFNDNSDINEKLNIIKKWSQSTFGNAGFLLVGYEAFRTLVFYHSYKNRGNVKPVQLEEVRDKVKSYLLNPGADLVVCDEGHIIKNNKSAISLAVSKITTRRRIILTGTPIQNNLKEYYSMVNFIKPSFLGTEKEFANLYANPIKNGQHKDSSKLDIKIMKQRSFVLHKKLSRFVQRKEAELLKTFLPEKFEYVLFIPMTEVQNNLYKYILDAIAKRHESKGRSLITDYTCLRKIWTHPKVLEDAWKNALEHIKKKDLQRNKALHSDDDQPDDIYDSQTGVMSVTNDWWRNLINSDQLESILPSNKLRATFEILRMCEENGEKCLIFSAFVAVLNVVEFFFKKITNGDPLLLNELSLNNSQKTSNVWLLGKDYYRLDGKTPKSLRHEMIKQFNMSENRRARVFLISAKAGGQGINLIGANRVIILDTSWNPSNDQQNIFRIFRLGQKRKCFIYRLLAMGTMEEKVYSRSVTKQAMSFRVVDEQQIDRHYSMAELTELYTLTSPDFVQRPIPVVPHDSILASLLLNLPKVVYKYHEHDSLLENKVEQELSEQEKKDAWIAYERDLQMNTQIQNLPNPENIQYNNLNISKLMNGFGQTPMFDMSAAGLGQLNPLTVPYGRGHYNYSANPTQHQQYLEMLHLYQKCLMPYPTDAYTNPASLYSGIDTSKPMHPGIHSTPSSPLAALGDLSIYGLSQPRPSLKSSNILPQFTTPLPPVLHHLPNYGKVPGVPNSNMSMIGSMGVGCQFGSNSSNSHSNIVGRNTASVSQTLGNDYQSPIPGRGLLTDKIHNRRPYSNLKAHYEDAMHPPQTSNSVQKADEETSKHMHYDNANKAQNNSSSKNKGTVLNVININDEAQKNGKWKNSEMCLDQNVYGSPLKSSKVGPSSTKTSKKNTVESIRDQTPILQSNTSIKTNSSNDGKVNSKYDQSGVQNNEMQVLLNSTISKDSKSPHDLSTKMPQSHLRAHETMSPYSPYSSYEKNDSKRMPSSTTNLSSIAISEIARSPVSPKQYSKKVKDIHSKTVDVNEVNNTKKNVEKSKSTTKRLEATSQNNAVSITSKVNFHDAKLSANPSMPNPKAAPGSIGVRKVSDVESHAKTYNSAAQSPILNSFSENQTSTSSYMSCDSTLPSASTIKHVLGSPFLDPCFTSYSDNNRLQIDDTWKPNGDKSLNKFNRKRGNQPLLLEAYNKRPKRNF